jgi:hypothetical protein
MFFKMRLVVVLVFLIAIIQISGTSMLNPDYGLHRQFSAASTHLINLVIYPK